MDFLQINQSIPQLKAETIFKIGDIPITNSILLTWLTVLIIVLLSVYLKKNLKLKAFKKIQLIFEIILEGMVNMLDQITGSRKRSYQILPIVGSIFLFFLLTNVISLIPGISALTFRGVSIFRTPTTDFNTTLALAILVILLSQMVSIKTKGIFGHLGEYFQFKNVWQSFKEGFGKGITSIIYFAMGLLDIISELAKVISLSLRLFGNMFAGEVLLVVIMSFLAFAAPSLLIAQTLLVGALQAMVFSVLSAVYLNLSFKNTDK